MATESNYGGISSEAVKAKTGRGWDEWIRLLDKADAHKLTHKQIAALLHEKHGVRDWWAQMVTVGYEQAKGLRDVHQKADGYSANASRTVAAPLETVFAMWADEKSRAKLLGNAKYRITTTPGKWLRLAFADGTRANIGFYAAGEQKSKVTVEHNKLASAKDVQERKEFWSGALDRLQEELKTRV